ncbi:MAG: ribosome silencing factor [Candidatus Acidiferrales bacterium]
MKAAAPKAVERAAQAALDKKARDLALLSLDGVATFTGYFLLCTGESRPQIQAIADSIQEKLGQEGLKLHHVEGYQLGEWVLLDYMDFIVHIFSPKARSFYDLERLWRPATRLPVPEDSRAG